MIIENSGLIGLKSELGYLDETTEKLGFVRGQWEYYRATYDYKIVDDSNNDEYYLRINTRAIEGKLEQKDAVLNIEHVYIGRATYPQGLDYDSDIPKHILSTSDKKIAELKQQLS